MAPPESRSPRAAGESGQAALLLLGVMAALLVGALFLGALGNALGARGRHQRAVDLGAVSAARAMADVYPRLFEPVYLGDGVPNPRHLSLATYRSLARRTAVVAARRNGVDVEAGEVSFPRGSFAPTRVMVVARGVARVRVQGSRRPARISVRARATAELVPAGGGPGLPDHASGGGYSGPLAYRQGKGSAPHNPVGPRLDHSHGPPVYRLQRGIATSARGRGAGKFSQVSPTRKRAGSPRRLQN